MNSSSNSSPAPRVSICLVNYKTAELTRLCLRSIRKRTHNIPYEVIVVDNDSGDASLEYLRSLRWIRLIERPGQVTKSGSWAHGTGLDLGLAAARGEFFLALHSDVFIRRDGWLDWLLGRIEARPNIACAGSGKLDLRPRWLEFLRNATDFKRWWRRATIDDPRKLDFYVRAICAVYRRELLLREKLGFAMDVDQGMTCGKRLYFELLDRGFATDVVRDFEMARYVHHLAHATMVLNPEFKVRSKTDRKCRKKMAAILASPEIQEIQDDDRLDQ